MINTQLQITREVRRELLKLEALGRVHRVSIDDERHWQIGPEPKDPPKSPPSSSSVQSVQSVATFPPQPPGPGLAQRSIAPGPSVPRPLPAGALPDARPRFDPTAEPSPINAARFAAADPPAPASIRAYPQDRPPRVPRGRTPGSGRKPAFVSNVTPDPSPLSPKELGADDE